MSRTCTQTSSASSSRSTTPTCSPPYSPPRSPPRYDPRLETWDDPTPRPSPYNLDDLSNACIAALKHRLRLRAKSPTREEMIRRRQQHDRHSLLIALSAYAKQNHMQSSALELVEVKERNLIDEQGKGYVHFNFVVKVSDGSLVLFLAELHPDCRDEDDIYLCSPLGENDQGHCFGCKDRAKDLVHPTVGGYLGGHLDVCFPFMECQVDSDGDDI